MRTGTDPLTDRHPDGDELRHREPTPIVVEDRTVEDRTVEDRTVEDRTVEDRTVEDRITERLVLVDRSRGTWLWPFVAGVVTTLVALAFAVGVYLLASDAGGDIGVPAVDERYDP